MKNILSKKISLITLTTIIFSILILNSTILAECGDIDGNESSTDISDLMYMVDYMFRQGPPPPIIDNAEANGDGRIDITDLICYVDYLFDNGPPPICFPVHKDSSGECLTTPILSSRLSNNFECIMETDSVETMELKIIGDKLIIYHNNALYNCCSMYKIDFTYEYQGELLYITATESDTTNEPCDCMCYFNFESVFDLEEFQGGMLQVILIDENSDTVGNESIFYYSEGYLTTEVSDGNLHIYHHNATMNCCPGYYVDYTIENNNITVIENDSIYGCRCLCPYNLESTLYNLRPGEYIITLLSTFLPYDTIMIGVDSIIIPDTSIHIIETNKSSCKSDEFQYDTLNIEYFLIGDTLIVNHYNSYFNCAFEFNGNFIKAGDTLRFYELNSSVEAATCMCYYDIEMQVLNISPGSYIAEVYKRDYPGEPPYLFDRRQIDL